MDGGAYVLWKDDTTETSGTYSGQLGHTYGFYSVARDNVGNEEQAPGTADATITIVEASEATSPVYRFWKASDNTHFYTIKESEKDKLIRDYSHVYTYEGPAYRAFKVDQQPAEALPVYRFWKPSDNTHFYTTKESEKQKLIDNYSHIYTFEGAAYYAYSVAEHPIDALPVYRFWKPPDNTHFFTITESEKDKLIPFYSPSLRSRMPCGTPTWHEDDGGQSLPDRLSPMLHLVLRTLSARLAGGRLRLSSGDGTASKQRNSGQIALPRGMVRGTRVGDATGPHVSDRSKVRGRGLPFPRG